ncbi:MAG: hypothetical protein GY847_04405, partial [Proteobacteria bacterium]|nr:hypothetical protein [Pseudomonadota bacterium]
TQYAPSLLGVLILSGFYLIQSHNYLLFHSLEKVFNCRQHVRVGLEWVCQEPIGATEAGGEPGKFILPPVETLQALLGLTMMGDVKGLVAGRAGPAGREIRTIDPGVQTR